MGRQTRYPKDVLLLGSYRKCMGNIQRQHHALILLLCHRYLGLQVYVMRWLDWAAGVANSGPRDIRLVNYTHVSKVLPFPPRCREQWFWSKSFPCRIWASHSSGYEEFYLLGITPCSPLEVNGPHGGMSQKVELFKCFHRPHWPQKEKRTTIYVWKKSHKEYCYWFHLKQSVTEMWLSYYEIGSLLTDLLLQVPKIFGWLLVALTYVFFRNKTEWLHLVA
jgi:hypothetical protein